MNDLKSNKLYLFLLTSLLKQLRKEVQVGEMNR